MQKRLLVPALIFVVVGILVFVPGTKAQYDSGGGTQDVSVTNFPDVQKVEGDVTVKGPLSHAPAGQEGERHRSAVQARRSHADGAGGRGVDRRLHARRPQSPGRSGRRGLPGRHGGRRPRAGRGARDPRPQPGRAYRVSRSRSWRNWCRERVATSIPSQPARPSDLPATGSTFTILRAGACRPTCIST